MPRSPKTRPWSLEANNDCGMTDSKKKPGSNPLPLGRRSTHCNLRALVALAWGSICSLSRTFVSSLSSEASQRRRIAVKKLGPTPAPLPPLPPVRSVFHLPPLVPLCGGEIQGSIIHHLRASTCEAPLSNSGTQSKPNLLYRIPLLRQLFALCISQGLFLLCCCSELASSFPMLFRRTSPFLTIRSQFRRTAPM